MRNRAGQRRPVRVLGAFLVAVLAASGAFLAVGTDVASADTANWVVIGNPTALRQNTQGNETFTTIDGTEYVVNSSGASAAFAFDVPSWTAGQTLDITVAPNDAGHPGLQCATTPQPQGVNQSTPQAGNYVGFANFRDPEGEDPTNGVVPPLVVSSGVVTSGPHPGGVAFDFDLLNEIPCSSADPLNDGVVSFADESYATLRLTFLNSGVNGHVELGNGIAQPPAPLAAGPIIMDIGFGAEVGPVHFSLSGNGAGAAAGPLPSSVTVVGQDPVANVPPSSLQRNSASDAVSGPISEFSIVENVANALPPTDGTPPSNPMGPNQFNNDNNEWTHNLQASASGAVCLVLDNGQGNNLRFGGATAWSVTANAGTAGFSAAAGSPAVAGSNSDVLFLPVTSSSNGPATWTTTGLSLAGTAYADGPVYAWAYWINGIEQPDGRFLPPPAGDCPDGPAEIAFGWPAYTLGYVQLTTISELAPAVFGTIAESTAAQAVNHQFDYAKGHCVSNTIGPDFFYGPSIFLARSDFYADGLGAAYAAGSVNSGVLLTPPTSLNQQAEQTIRLQGVSTVFITGRELAISEEVEEQLDNTIAFQCGGTQPRIDPLTGLPQTLNVVRLGGENQYDTNNLLATFVGAQPPAAFGAFGATSEFNSTAGTSTAGPTPGGAVNTALLVTGENFQDAAVASVPAYGGDFITPIGETGPMPLIATTPDTLSPQAVNSIFDQHIGQVLIVGGPLAVSDNVMNQLADLGVYAIRIAGADYTETSTQLASFELSLDLGFGYLNWDFDWDSYVNRTAGNINFNQNRQVSARVVMLARGDWYADTMAAAAVLSIHNGRWINPQKFPLITSWDNTTLGGFPTDWLVNASRPVSGLVGQTPAHGRDDQPGISFPAGDDCVNRSSNAFTIQPIGGPQALSDGLRQEAVDLIGSGESLILPGVSLGCFVRDIEQGVPDNLEQLGAQEG